MTIALSFDLNTLSPAQLYGLGRGLETSNLPSLFPAFSTWFHGILVAEHKRRTAGEPEAATITLPEWLDNNELADFLEGTTALSFHGEIESGAAPLLDELVIRVVALASARLKDMEAMGRALHHAVSKGN